MKHDQLDLFESIVLSGVDSTGTTQGCYTHAATSLGLTPVQFWSETRDLGPWGKRSKWAHKVRSVQSKLKSKGLIERGVRTGEWVLTEKGRLKSNRNLSFHADSQLKVAFVTKSGMAFFGKGECLASLFPGEVELIFCSPPYLTNRPYGHLTGAMGAVHAPSEEQYVETLLRMIEQWLPLLTPSGSLVLNLGSHSATKGDGEMDLTNESLVIRLRKELGLRVLEKAVAYNPTRPPSGSYTTGTHGLPRCRLTRKTEDIYWLSLNPRETNRKASTDRALISYSKSYEAAIKTRESGGFAQTQASPSGHSKTKKTYGVRKEGAIPSNMMQYHPEHYNSSYSKECKSLGLPRHPAMASREIVEPWIKICTEPGDLVADPCFGSGKTGQVAESLGRYWIGADTVFEYLQGASLRF